MVKKKDLDNFYMDGTLKEQLLHVKKKVLTKDEDYFFALDGDEGSGKSVLGLQIAKFIDPSFCMDRVVFNAKDFQDSVLSAKKGQVVLFDEAFRGLSSRGALSEINKLLVALMMECRQKNLIVIIVMPSFFLLDKYAALFRSKGLFHVYRHKGKRGFWMYFNKQGKKLLYLKGKATYSYSYPKSAFRGRFLEHYTVDEKEYRAKKYDALMMTNRNTRAETFMDHRNLLLWFLRYEMGMNNTDISYRMKDFGWKISINQISECIGKKKNQLQSKGIIE